MKRLNRKDLARNIELVIWTELKGLSDDSSPFEWCVEFERKGVKHLLDQDDCKW